MAALSFQQGQRLTPSLHESTGASTNNASDGDDPPTDTSSAPPSHRRIESESNPNSLPVLSHRLKHDSSILAIVLSDERIYAGTQAGEILVYALDTYEKKAVIEGHAGSVLSLCLSQDQKLLFSGAGDRILNIWNTSDLTRNGCLYSSFDVGDIFCVAWSSALQTVYLGAQNTTIQWCSPKAEVLRSGQRRHVHPSLRDDKFFDSAGPGGIRTPRPPRADMTPRHAVGGAEIEIEKTNVKHFAHYGYVMCMILVKDGIPEAHGYEVLITGGGDGIVKLWTLDEKNNGAIKELYALEDGREEGHSIHALAIDGTFLYTSRSGGEVDVWDLETRQLVRNLKAHRDDVLTICVGGGFLFSASVTGYMRKFDRQYALRGRMRAHEGRILASAFVNHKNRPVYVTGGSDNTIAVWDVSGCIGSQASSLKSSDELLVDYLRRFVSYKTVSSDARFQVDCRRGASFLRAVFKNFGASTEMLVTSSSYNPVILARFRGNPATREKRKTILFYGHYDVVAADDGHDKWIVDPFALEGIDGYLYGRGTSDNKGPIMAAIFACAELTREQNLGSDIVFLIEGEEETGSRGFEKTIQANKDKIGDIDWILLANSYWLDDRIPCLTYGLRGVIHATVQIESSHPDLHSGVDGSAQLDEPLKDLVMLLSSLTGKNGKVEIPGFYDPIPPLTSEEQELYADITGSLVQRNPSLGDPDVLAASLMRRWREASLTIHRFQTSGPDNATIIPRMAKAAISMRLVPNQTTEQITTALVAYLHAEFSKLDSKNKLVVSVDHRAEPWLGDWTNKIFQTLEEAIMEAWGPIDFSHRRHSSGKPPRFTLPSRENSTNGVPIVSAPATSAVLANSSATPPKPQSPLAEVNSKLAQAADAQKQKSQKRRPGTETTQPPSTQRRKPLYIREGGSIPAIRFLEKEFNAPAAHFPCGQASDSAHLNNERLRLLNLYKSRDIFKKVFRELPQR